MRKFSAKKIILAAFAVSAVSLSASLGFNWLEKSGVGFSKNPASEKLKIAKTASSAYSFKTLSGDLVEIGSQKTTGQPYLKLNKWGGEASLKISFPEIAGIKPSFDGQKLTYSAANSKQTVWWQKLLPDRFLASAASARQSGKMEVAFYSRRPEQIIETDSSAKQRTYTVNEDGGVEFDTILYEKPDGNAISYPMETENLDFFYQPPLNEGNRNADLVCTETECKDKDNNIASYRSENVVGSYAVYYKDGKSGDYSAMGGQNYKTGKAFHIYRPKVTDAAGKEIWGELHIDASANILTVTVPQEFLDAAVYPVRIDPNFGYESNGGTGWGGTANYYDGGIFISPPDAGSAAVSKISIYMRAPWGDATHVKGLIFSANTGTKAGTLLTNGAGSIITFSSSTAAWYDSVFASSPTLAAGTNYFLAGVPAETGQMEFRYDSGAAGDKEWEKSGSYASPASFAAATEYASTKFSIYAAYTAAPSSACANHSLSGWAWSENIGWISFSCKNASSTVNYGVDKNSLTGLLSGQAWSENIGWISFSSADLSGCPSGACEARMSTTTYAISGWARALAAPSSASGWDGWIKLNGTAGGSTPYGVFLNNSTKELYGWAWGGNTANATSAGVIGWISFNCSNQGACGSVPYKVRYVVQPPTIADLAVPANTSDNYCSCYFDGSSDYQTDGDDSTPSFTWTYHDPDDLLLGSYQFRVNTVNDVNAANPAVDLAITGRSDSSGGTIVQPVAVKVAPGANELAYNVNGSTVYHWWVKSCNQGGACSADWTQGPDFSTPAKHYPIVRVAWDKKTISTGETVQFCSTADIASSSDPCYPVCWTGSTAPVVNPDNPDWACSVCFDSSNNYQACQAVGSSYNWYFPGIAGTDYAFQSSTSATSPNPKVEFLTVGKNKDIKLNIFTGSDSCAGDELLDANLPIPIWKETSPY